MADAKELFQGSSHAEIYSLFRPTIPQKVINFILRFLQEQKEPPYLQAIDIGCGNGQSTVVLEPYFQKVLGLDVSEAQIEVAQKQNILSNIVYEVGSAEKLPLPDSSVELISMANCAHWVDMTQFQKEAERVLMPGGVAALFGYALPKPRYGNISDKLSDMVLEFADVHLAGYWNEKVMQQNKRRYRDLTLPFPEIIWDDSIYEDVKGTLANFMGLLNTWSAVQTMKKTHPEKLDNLLHRFQEQFLEIIGAKTTPEETPIIVRWEYHILMGRKPS